ncbi:MAG: WYL domain-containing protein [Myxococcales bacterium]
MVGSDAVRVRHVVALERRCQAWAAQGAREPAEGARPRPPRARQARRRRSPCFAADLRRPRQDGPELLSAVEECFTRGLCLAFDYVDRRGTPTKRTVEPHGLLVETPAWYLLCRDVEKRAVRMFRIDRIRQARVLNDRPFLPDLEAVFREWKVQQAASSPSNGGDPRSSDSLPRAQEE